MDAGIPAGLTPAENRKFGLTVGAAFLVLAGIMLWRHHEIPMWIFGALGVLLVLGGLLVPGRMGPVYRGWMKFGLALSKITTPIIMGLMYFLVFAPMGFLRRTFGTSPMERPAGETYWIARPEGARRSNLMRQF